jgi:hypothetical protein
MYILYITIFMDPPSASTDEVIVSRGDTHMTRQEHASEIEKKRTVLGLYDASFNVENLPKYTLGLVVYVVIFVLIIPYTMIRNNVSEEIILAYVPNVDIMATVLGFDGGPFSNIWRYLYNPSNLTMFGFISTNLMNYFALLGVTFAVAWQTHKHKSWIHGWSAAFIFLIVTYLAPGNIIVILQNWVAEYIKGAWGIGDNESALRYALVVAFGLILSVCIIFTESVLIKVTRSPIEHCIRMVHNSLR